MRTSVVLSVLALCLLAAAPCAAQGAGSACDISGTWYGGNPYTPFQLTITPIGAGRYSVVAQQGIDVRLFGGSAITNWSGELRRNAHTYDWYAMLYWISPLADPSDPLPLPELDIVHSRIEFGDCNTLNNTIDTYGAYLAFNPPYFDEEGTLIPGRTPFVDPVDVDIMAIIGVTELYETYHRLPIGILPPAAPASASQ